MDAAPPPGSLSRPNRQPDLADHFAECLQLGRFLTVFDESRFIITDDFSAERQVKPIWAAAAATFSKDPLVGQAALTPLCDAARGRTLQTSNTFDRLCDLIGERAATPETRSIAVDLLNGGPDGNAARDISKRINSLVTPARQHYYEFLKVIRTVTEGGMSSGAFRDEFRVFTNAVAGRLDFGIFSFCIDKLIAEPRVPLEAKGQVALEILGFPPAVRREILTNILASPQQDPVLTRFIRNSIERELDYNTVAELRLMETLKVTLRSHPN